VNAQTAALSGSATGPAEEFPLWVFLRYAFPFNGSMNIRLYSIPNGIPPWLWRLAGFVTKPTPLPDGTQQAYPRRNVRRQVPLTKRPYLSTEITVCEDWGRA
jgi:hypothetical protein